MYEYNIRTSIPEVTWQFVSFKVENTDFKGRYNFKGGGGAKQSFTCTLVLLNKLI